MRNQKERLERELEHLLKAYRAGIISEDEYFKARDKVETRLRKLEEELEKEEKTHKIISDIIDRPSKKGKDFWNDDDEEIIKKPKFKPKIVKKLPLKKLSKINKKVVYVKPKPEKRKEAEEKPKKKQVKIKDDVGKNSVWLFTVYVIILFLLVVLLATYFISNNNNDSKKITIYEYSDFECPFSKQVQPTLKMIKDAYGEQVKIVFKQYPMESIHPNAMLLAEASECADDQQKFFEFHNKLFDMQGAITTKDQLLNIALELDMDDNLFENCLEKHLKLKNIQQDIKEGKELGVNEIPTFIIDGEKLIGPQPFEVFKEVIDRKLK